MSSNLIFHSTALIGWLLERREKNVGILAIPLYFVLTNLASLIAFYKFLRGENYARWEPLRETKENTANSKIYVEIT